MSLLDLPDETVSQIVCNLSLHDRETLTKVHPRLTRTLSPSNDAFWHAIHTSRFRHHKPPPKKLLHSLPWHHLCTLQDTADEYLIHKSLPFSNLLPPSPHKPLVTPSETALHIAAGVLHTWHRAHPHWQVAGRTTLPDVATSQAAGAYGVAVGLRNGMVSIVPYCRRDGATRHVAAHRGAVTCVQTRGEVIISGSNDGTIRTGGARRGGSRGLVGERLGRVKWLHVAKRGGDLFSHGGEDGVVRQWDLERGACVSVGRVDGGVTCEGATDEGVLFACAGGKCVHVLDARVGMKSCVGILSVPHGGGIDALAMAEDGGLVACGVGGVFVWDARGGWVARPLGGGGKVEEGAVEGRHDVGAGGGCGRGGEGVADVWNGRQV